MARVPALLADERDNVEKVARAAVRDGTLLVLLREELDALDGRIGKVGRIKLVQEAGQSAQCSKYHTTASRK